MVNGTQCRPTSLSGRPNKHINTYILYIHTVHTYSTYIQYIHTSTDLHTATPFLANVIVDVFLLLALPLVIKILHLLLRYAFRLFPERNPKYIIVKQFLIMIKYFYFQLLHWHLWIGTRRTLHLSQERARIGCSYTPTPNTHRYCYDKWRTRDVCMYV